MALVQINQQNQKMSHSDKKNNSAGKGEGHKNQKSEKKNSPDRKCEYGVKNSIRLCTDSNCRQKRGRCVDPECCCNNKDHAKCKDFLNYSYIKNLLQEYESLNQRLNAALQTTLNSISQSLMQVYKNISKDYTQFIQPPKELKLVARQISIQNVENVKKFFINYPGFELPEKITKKNGQFEQMLNKIKLEVKFLTSAKEIFIKNTKKIIEDSRILFEKQIKDFNEEKKARLSSKIQNLPAQKNQMREG